jgi:hypothetical protein
MKYILRLQVNTIPGMQKGTVIKLRWNYKRDLPCNITQFLTNTKAKDKLFFLKNNVKNTISLIAHTKSYPNETIKDCQAGHQSGDAISRQVPSRNW